ncbi:MAG: PIG-L deacetylase family protein [Opitutales bacterium]
MLKKPDPYIPDGVCPAEAQARCTHLGIGAHQDDLEFMAFHGISLCYEEAMQWFGAVTCTDGGGRAHTGPYAGKTDEQMRAIRMEEQREAARIGRYSFASQLGFTSASVKAGADQKPLVDALEQILACTQPDIVYTHNPADKHPTHVGVCQAAMAAILRLPPSSRPKKLYGCEVWRDLDWLCDADKVAFDVSAHPELAEALNACFQSQITAGKDYARAVIGRRRANATFFQSHTPDTVDQLWYAMDLTPLIEDENPPELSVFVREKLERFQAAVLDGLGPC